jgi:Ca2+-binding EF-hand superfamily protein
VLYTGFITLEEMATIVQSLDRRPTIEEIRDMICEVYIDGNGTLHFEEFLNVMGRKQKVNNNMK